MLNRLLIGAAGLVAGTLVATPAVLGLSGNSSFSRDIRVPVPSGAHAVHFVEPEPGDDRSTSSGPVPTESREDRPGHDVGSSDATDDHGGLRASGGPGRGGLDDGPRHDAGDDRGGRRGGDDRRGSHSGRDDGSSGGSADGSDGRGHG
jgi:hypothetical protein